MASHHSQWNRLQTRQNAKAALDALKRVKARHELNKTYGQSPTRRAANVADLNAARDAMQRVAGALHVEERIERAETLADLGKAIAPLGNEAVEGVVAGALGRLRKDATKGRGL